jgi:sugar-phosphatase
VASRIGVDPHRCAVIEDAPHGLEAAKRAGMRTIGVTTTHAAAALADGDLVVDSLAEGAVRQFVLA